MCVCVCVCVCMYDASSSDSIVANGAIISKQRIEDIVT
jgi:hypothetical protein